MDKSKPNKKLQGIYVSGTTAGSEPDTFSKFPEKYSTVCQNKGFEILCGQKKAARIQSRE